MKRLIPIIAFSLACVGFTYAALTAKSALAGSVQTPQALLALPTQPVPTATDTPIPTATVGYQATIEVMAADNLQKAQEIAYLMQTQTWATAEADRRAHELVMLTAQADMLTATAALTAIPATETQQAAVNTQVAGNATLVVGSWTATAAAPTQVVRAAMAQAQAETAGLRAGADAVAPVFGWLFGLVVVGGLLWIIARRQPEAPRAEAPAAPRIVNHVRAASSDPWAGTVRRIPEPPGDAGKVRIWAEAALNGASVAVNPWEENGTPFTGDREYRHGIYAWLMQFGLTELRGRLVLNALGREIVGDWLAAHPSPTEDFEPESAPQPPMSMEPIRMETEGEAESGEVVDG